MAFSDHSEHRLLGPLLGFCVRRREQLSYLIVGGWNTLFGYGIWALLNSLLHRQMHYLAIVVISWILAVLNAYFCYRVFVFRSKGSVWRELPRFFLVYLGGLVTTLVMLPILVRVIPLNLYAIQAMLGAVVIVLTYLAHKYFSFASARGNRGTNRVSGTEN